MQNLMFKLIGKARHGLNSVNLSTLCKGAFRDDLKHFNPPRTASGWPCKFGSSLCSNRPVLAQRCSGLSPGPRKAWKKNLLLILCIPMHACVARCYIPAHSSWFVFGEWPVIFPYNTLIQRHNITAEVQRWHSTQGYVWSVSCVQVMSGRTSNQFDEKHPKRHSKDQTWAFYCPRAISSPLIIPVQPTWC